MKGAWFAVGLLAMAGCTPPGGYVFDGRVAESGVDVVVPGDSFDGGVDVTEAGVDAAVVCEGGPVMGPDAGLIDAATVCDGGACDPAVAIASGQVYTCAVRRSGIVTCWGGNAFMELGVPDATASFVRAVPGLPSCDPPVQIGAHGLQTCVLLQSSAVYCWGESSHGELGSAAPPGASGPPTRISGLPARSWTQLAAGSLHDCVFSSGTVYCWGDNTHGAVGQGAISTGSDTSRAPAMVTGLPGTVASLWSGGGNSCAVLSDGTALCWGRNTSGEVGNGQTVDTGTPAVVMNLTGAASIAVGFGALCAVDPAGRLQCWGSNQYGDFGEGTDRNARNAPIGWATRLPHGVSGLTAGDNHFCALDGPPPSSVWCWGRNDTGQTGVVGDGGTDQVTPVQVPGIADAIALSAGSGFSCALRANGSVVCWGDNSVGQLGEGNTGNQPGRIVPVLGIP